MQNLLAADELYTLRLRKAPPLEPDSEASTSDHKALIHRLFSEVVNQQKLELLDDMVRPDFQVSRPNGPSGPDALKGLIRWLHTAFADLHYEVDDLVAERDKVVARTRAHGVHHGIYLEIAATGRPVTYTEAFTLRIANHKIAEW